MSPTIEQLRESIDTIDHKILSLLAERLRLVLQVGEVKKVSDIAVYDPGREARMLKSLAEAADPQLSPATVHSIFSTIIRECRGLEQESIAPSRPAE